METFRTFSRLSVMRGFKALLATLVALTLYSFLVFSLYWTIPSDPVAGILNRSSLTFLHSTSPQPLRHTPGPFWKQAQLFYEHILDGTWGVSFWTGSSVLRLILDRAPHTLWIALASLFVTYCLGIGLAYLQLGANNRTVSFLTRSSIALLLSIPAFCTCILLFILSPAGISHLLAVLVYSLSAAPYLAVLVYTHLKAETQTPYFQAALAKGLNLRQVIRKHLLPSVVGQLLAYLPFWWALWVGTSLVIEPILQIPGMGLLAFESFRNQDVAVLVGLALFYGSVRILLGGLRDSLFALTHEKWLGVRAYEP